jgi:hypothetical protein
MKVNRKYILPFILALTAVSLTGCFKERIEGNGNVTTENRTGSGFSRIISEGEFQVTVIYDSVAKIQVEAESNIIPYVRTSVSGNTIRIDFDNGVNIREHSTVKVTLYTLHAEYLELNGSGSIIAGHFNEDDVQLYLSGSGNIMSSFVANSINANISGSGSITADGTAQQTSLHISGSGNIHSLGLIQQKCTTTISGSGNIYVNVIENLVATISGSGSVYYTGNPALETHISGSGKVVRY